MTRQLSADANTNGGSRPALQWVAGLDEAGRGCLAGPVYAAAVILPEGHSLQGLNDSKALSQKARERLFPQIQQQALAWCIATASVAEIDSLNILQASLLAMRRAVAGLTQLPTLCLVDGNQDPRLNLPTQTVIDGDALIEIEADCVIP